MPPTNHDDVKGVHEPRSLWPNPGIEPQVNFTSSVNNTQKLQHVATKPEEYEVSVLSDDGSVNHRANFTKCFRMVYDFRDHVLDSGNKSIAKARHLGFKPCNGLIDVHIEFRGKDYDARHFLLRSRFIISAYGMPLDGSASSSAARRSISSSTPCETGTSSSSARVSQMRAINASRSVVLSLRMASMSMVCAIPTSIPRRGTGQQPLVTGHGPPYPSCP